MNAAHLGEMSATHMRVFKAKQMSTIVMMAAKEKKLNKV